jgi:hypothetical protein
MSNIRVLAAAAMLAAPAMWAVTSIVSDPGAQQVSLATPAQVDTYALMSSSHRLPIQAYDSY